MRKAVPCRTCSLAAVLMLFGVTSNVAQSLPPEYQRLFVQRADQRSRFERALNLIGKTGFPVGRSFALIAGVTQYPNFPKPEKSLKPAAIDIQKLQTYLKEEEFFDEIVVLKDGDMTLANLNYFLENYFPQKLSESPHSRFLFAYSGHGYSVPTDNTVRGYLLTNAATSLTDPVNRLDLDVLRTMLSPIIDSAEKALVLINSCDSGAFLGRKGFGLSPLGPGEKGAYAIMASRSKQQSLHLDAVGPGSVFFEKIIAGLGGPADKSPPDGVVTYHELDSYLHEEIPYATNGSQTPTEGDISRNGSVGEFFFLNRTRQLAFGNAPAWDPKTAVAFGVVAEDLFVKGVAAFRKNSYDDAIVLCTQAADAGNSEAMTLVGYMYQLGKGVAQNYSEARQWYEKGAAAGNADAMFNLGFMYIQGDGVPQDHAQAQQWFEKGAAAGSADAMDDLGLMYVRGDGVPKEYVRALHWFEKGAAAGSADAMFNLGSMYFRGDGVSQSFAQARQWYEKGAAAGSAGAMSNLGLMYIRGDGVPQSFTQARQWDEKGAAAGSADAMDGLGLIYIHGDGVPKDDVRALQWFKKGAAAGNADAMNNLGLMYVRGDGVPQSFAQAQQWFEQGAAAGSAGAMFNLGSMYVRGDGVPQSFAQARQWFEKGAAAGNADATDALKRLPN